MRTEQWLVGLAILAAPAQAAPLPPGPPPVKDRKELRANARQYAQQLTHLVEQIHQNYVRAVPREDLLETAVLGLYEAARRPAPRHLRAQIRQAVALATMLRARADSRDLQAVSAEKPLVDPVEQLLMQLREVLGDSEGLAGQNPVLISCRAMARLLDPHSGLVTAEEQRRAVGTDQEHLGVGLEFRDALTPGPLVIAAVHLGSPAQRADLRPGDVITRIEGQPAAKAPPGHLLALRGARVMPDIAPLAAPTSSAVEPADLPAVVKVQYRRPGEKKERSATLLRERYRAETVLGVRRREDNSWDWFVDEKAGLAHVRVATLGRGTSEELREVLFRLRERKARGLILDLRWCPGGYLNEAVDSADLFLGAGVVATVKSRNREDTVYRSTDEEKFKDFVVVVLVNGETSGGAELIAAALQDHRRALVVGQRTLGKGSVQTPLALGVEGVGFKLTSGTFLRPGGKNLHRFPDSRPEDDWGVVPDEDARLSRELGKRLKEWWQQLSLRPGVSRERQPLDDPRSDPQQYLALGVLRKRIAEQARARK